MTEWSCCLERYSLLHSLRIVLSLQAGLCCCQALRVPSSSPVDSWMPLTSPPTSMDSSQESKLKRPPHDTQNRRLQSCSNFPALLVACAYFSSLQKSLVGFLGNEFLTGLVFFLQLWIRSFGPWKGRRAGGQVPVPGGVPRKVCGQSSFMH